VSISETEPLEVFLYAIRSNATKSRYLNRLKNFLVVKTQARAFVLASNEKGRNWVYANVMKFLSYHKERAERGEVSNSSVRSHGKRFQEVFHAEDGPRLTELQQ
jgi:hypothetical protein